MKYITRVLLFLKHTETLSQLEFLFKRYENILDSPYTFIARKTTDFHRKYFGKTWSPKSFSLCFLLSLFYPLLFFIYSLCTLQPVYLSEP